MMSDFSTEDRVNLGIMASDMKRVQADIKDIKNTVTSGYVTKDEFDPVKRVAYWSVGGMGSLVLAFIMYLLTQRGGN